VSVEGALGEAAHRALERVLSLLAQERASVSSVTAPRQAWEVHVADSLSGLELAELRDAERIADIGAGAGFPGIALAVALPNAEVDLIESVRRKCDFLGRAIDAAGIANATVVCRRSEDWAAEAGREAYDAVTARAVGSLPTLAELASPLLRPDGVLVAWKGSRDRQEESRLAAAAEALAMRPERVLAVVPYAGSRDRHLHLVRKDGPTPESLPRRPGMAAKRPR
jgi:16S rRNA (guanine527-N7)-methyltransferase